MWRLESETGPLGPRILVQSWAKPDWAGIGVEGWLAGFDPSIDLARRLELDSLEPGRRFRFRLRANPCVKRNGKRLGLLRLEEQEAWIERKGNQHGYELPQPESFDCRNLMPERRIDVRVSQEQMLRGKQRTGNEIRVYSVLYDGFLSVTEPEKFRDALRTGIGHGKSMGLGLLSIAPGR